MKDLKTYNHVTLVGVVTVNPVEVIENKRRKTSFVLGVDRYTGKDTQKEVDYFNIVTFGKLAEICYQYLKAEKKVLVDGRLQVREDEEADYGRRWITEVIAENLMKLK